MRRYREIFEERQFECIIYENKKEIGRGVGKSKISAKTKASEEACANLSK